MVDIRRKQREAAKKAARASKSHSLSPAPDSVKAPEEDSVVEAIPDPPHASRITTNTRPKRQAAAKALASLSPVKTTRRPALTGKKNLSQKLATAAPKPPKKPYQPKKKAKKVMSDEEEDWKDATSDEEEEFDMAVNTSQYDPNGEVQFVSDGEESEDGVDAPVLGEKPKTTVTEGEFLTLSII